MLVLKSLNLKSCLGFLPFVTGYMVRKAFTVYKLGGVVSELLYSPAAFGLDMSTRNMPKPRGRICAQVNGGEICVI